MIAARWRRPSPASIAQKATGFPWRPVDPPHRHDARVQVAAKKYSCWALLLPALKLNPSCLPNQRLPRPSRAGCTSDQHSHRQGKHEQVTQLRLNVAGNHRLARAASTLAFAFSLTFAFTFALNAEC